MKVFKKMLLFAQRKTKGSRPFSLNLLLSKDYCVFFLLSLPPFPFSSFFVMHKFYTAWFQVEKSLCQKVSKF